MAVTGHWEQSPMISSNLLMEILVCLLWLCVAQLCGEKRYHCYEWKEHVHQRNVDNQLELSMRLRIEHTDEESRVRWAKTAAMLWSTVGTEDKVQTRIKGCTCKRLEFRDQFRSPFKHKDDINLLTEDGKIWQVLILEGKDMIPQWRALAFRMSAKHSLAAIWKFKWHEIPLIHNKGPLSKQLLNVLLVYFIWLMKAKYRIWIFLQVPLRFLISLLARMILKRYHILSKIEPGINTMFRLQWKDSKYSPLYFDESY